MFCGSQIHLIKVDVLHFCIQADHDWDFVLLCGILFGHMFTKDLILILNYPMRPSECIFCSRYMLLRCKNQEKNV